MRLNAYPADTFLDADPIAFRGQGSPPAAPSPDIDLEPLYRTQAPRLMRFFARRIGLDEARDLVHECFSGLIGTIGRQAHIERPEAYLSATANNLVARHRRTAARHATQFHIPSDDVPLVGCDLQTQLEARDMLDRLEAAMLRLRPMTREVFMARRIDGYSYREIAERTGLSVKRVEKHMSRAIAQLDHILSAR